MFQITKTLHFSYGHRLLAHKGKCRHLHGHNGVVEIILESERLDEYGMVADFGILREKAGKWLEETLDHRMILNSKDPAAETLKELGEPVTLIDAEPTAENLAEMIFKKVGKMGFPVRLVKFWETPSSCASYGEENERRKK